MQIIISALIAIILTFTSCLSLTREIYILAKKCEQKNTVDLVILCGETHNYGTFKKNRYQFERFEKLFALNPQQTCVLVEDMYDTSFWFQNEHAMMARQKYLQKFEKFISDGDEQRSTYDSIDLVTLSNIPARTINIECRQWFQKKFEYIETNKMYDQMLFKDIFKPVLSLDYYIKKSKNPTLKTIFQKIRKRIDEKIKIFKNTISKIVIDYKKIKFKSFFELKKLYLPQLKKYAQSFEDNRSPLDEMIEANALFTITNSHHYHTTFVFAGSNHHRKNNHPQRGLLPMLQEMGYILLATKKYEKVKACARQLPYLAQVFMQKSDAELITLMYKKIVSKNFS